jgi:large subunit ribosomal protein L17
MPHEHLPKLFGTLRERYASRPGGYTRVLRIEPLKPDMAPSAILELVDGPTDTRFAMTARTILRERRENKDPTDMTARNIDKVTRFRPGGEEALEEMVRKIRHLSVRRGRTDAASTERRWGGGV